MYKIFDLVRSVVTGAIVLVKNKFKPEDRPWKQAEGIVVDVIYKASSPKSKTLSSFCTIRFLDKHESGDLVITAEIPQPGNLFALEAMKGFFVTVLYRWDINYNFQQVLEVDVISFGTSSFGNTEELKKLMVNS